VIYEEDESPGKHSSSQSSLMIIPRKKAKKSSKTRHSLGLVAKQPPEEQLEITVMPLKTQNNEQCSVLDHE
jgi:hypothetical protein